MAGSLDDDDDDATPIFALETRVRDAAKGAGRVTCADASDGVVVVGTDAGACVVHDLTKNAKSASSSWTVDCDPSSSELRRAAANERAVKTRKRWNANAKRQRFDERLR